jgi:WD40-like Beta Propeller Repeat
MKMQRWAAVAVVTLAVALSAVSAAGALHGEPRGWGPAVNVAPVNTSALEGCPIESPDGKSLYFASNRPHATGTDLDIWVSHRRSTHDAWGPAEDLPAPVNSSANDFCPTPVEGGGLFFVSTRAGFCGDTANSDIYFARETPRHGWSEPVHFACAPQGPNTPNFEMGPSYFKAHGRGILYFSSGVGTTAGHIYASEQGRDGVFGPGTPVAELNSDYADLRPNVSGDGREIVFDSNRPVEGADRGFDIYTATRRSVDQPWSTPVNLGPNVNTDSNEHRASLSRDGTRLYFGSDRPGGSGDSDVYVSTRGGRPRPWHPR